MITDINIPENKNIKRFQLHRKPILQKYNSEFRITNSEFEYKSEFNDYEGKIIPEKTDGFFYGRIDNDENYYGSSGEKNSLYIRCDETVPLEYAEKCAKDFFSLSDETLEKIAAAVKAFFIRYRNMAVENECLDFFLTEELSSPVDENATAAEIMEHIGIQGINVCEPENPSEIGYSIDGWCEWEQEHGLEIVILNGKVLYVGTFEQNEPWDDYDTDDEWNYVNAVK